MEKVLPQIKNVVYLMMENRSLDNLLGWLYSDQKPLNFYPKTETSGYKGLITNPWDKLPDTDGVAHKVIPIPKAHEGKIIPYFDPYEAMVEPHDFWWNGVMNQLYGDKTEISKMPDTNQAPGMKGFLQDYYTKKMIEWEGLDITWTYSPAPKQAPIINSLAWMYGVSDSWYSSVPTQTNPNRAFSLCGTSLGRELNQQLSAVETYDVPTIFNRLAEAKDPKSWGLYYEGIWHNKKCFTDYTFPQIGQAKGGEIKPMADFFTRAKAGSLPAFTFLEPKWGYGYNGATYTQGNDYHPPTQIAPGESFLFKVYAALRESPSWNETLFVLTFDEHGGTYDHVVPPNTALNPDGIIGTEYQFNFKRYGLRVPTILMSPYIPRRTVFRKPSNHPHEYDHTSFIKTLLLWAGYQPSEMGLGKRVEAAPSFDEVLSTSISNDAGVELETVPFCLEPSDDENGIPEQSPEQGKPLNDLFGNMPHVSTKAIIKHSSGLEEIKKGIKKFHENPEEFESALENGEIPAW